MASFPVFDIDPRTFPMPTLEQGSPFGGVLSNAIAKRLAMAKAQEAEAEVPYAGLSKISDILSKNAYASAVMPQIANKAASNPAVWAQLTDDQKMALARGSASPATGEQNTFSPIMQKAMQIYQDQNKPKPGIFDNLMGLFTGNNNNTPPVQSSGGNGALMQDNGTVKPLSPLSTSNYAPGGMPINTITSTLPTGNATQYNLTPDEKIAQYNRVKAKGVALGTKEGAQQAQYGEDAAAVIDQDKSLNSLNNSFQSPTIKKIADVPFATQKSLSWYKQTGTPDQRREVGKLETNLKMVVSSSLKMFGSRATDLDVKFIQGMKPDENDTIDVMQGKWEALKTYTNAKKEQIKLANQFMNAGDTKADAEFKAASEVNLDAARDMAYRRLIHHL